MPPSEIERVPLSGLEHYMQALKELLEAESPKSAGTAAEQNFT